MKYFKILTAFGLLISLCKCSHFYGGSITWKALNVNALKDVDVLIQWRFFWRSTMSANHFCNDTKIINGDLIGDSGFISCQVGCSPTNFKIDSKVICSDYSLSDNWSGGQRSTQITFPNQTYVEGNYKGGAWLSLVTGGSSWELRFRMNFARRTDIKKINSPPTCLVKPITIMRQGCQNTLKIFTSDPDGDKVKCRWSNSSLSECGSICSSVPGAVLDEENCILKFSPSAIGYYAVAIQVEDFAYGISNFALSSVPVQFLIKSENLSCVVNKLEFQDPTFKDDSCVFVEFNKTFKAKIVVLSTSRVIEIATLSPKGLIKSSIDNYNNNQSLWYVDLTWTVVDPDQIGVNLFCFEAINIFDEKTDQRCVSLVVDGKAPSFNNPFPTGLVEPVIPFFSIQSSNVPITKSTSPGSYIRIFNSRNVQIVQIESISANVAVQNSKTLIFKIDYNFTYGETYYILFDSNIVQSNQSCALESLPIVDKKFWFFTIKAAPTIIKTSSSKIITSTVKATLSSTTLLTRISSTISNVPTTKPSTTISNVLTTKPSTTISNVPTTKPSTTISNVPTTKPSTTISNVPTTKPSTTISNVPTTKPSTTISNVPTTKPSTTFSNFPTTSIKVVPQFSITDKKTSSTSTITSISEKENGSTDADLNTFYQTQMSSIIKFFEEFTKKALVGMMTTIGAAGGLVAMVAMVAGGIGLVVHKINKKSKVSPAKMKNKNSSNELFRKRNPKKEKLARNDSNMSMNEDVESNLDDFDQSYEPMSNENVFNNNRFQYERPVRNANRIDFRMNPEQFEINRSNLFGYESVSAKPKFIVKR